MYVETQDYALYGLRRKALVDQIKAIHSNKQGILLLLANFEDERVRFLQESSFYYYTGIQEPGTAALVTLDGVSTLFIPQCSIDRTIWVANPITLDQAQALGFDALCYSGQKVQGYQQYPFFTAAEYENIIEALSAVIAQGGSIFTLFPEKSLTAYKEQRFIIDRLTSYISNLRAHLVDVSSCVAAMRRSKTAEELEYMYRAVEVTAVAQEAAVKAIGDNVHESEVQASLEYMITGSGARMAFPSIVASGPNTTILHYNAHDRIMNSGDLVVVDIGAQVEGYCADITRTYPVSGTFTKRQKELYSIVLDVQAYIADIAKPGMWLSNKDLPDQSLNHMAKKYLAGHGGYDTYFPHGIGHFLGLDVHDVGDTQVPLQEDDVITIEPGIYIPQEGIGIRIEDNYWIVPGGAVCLSDEIPKSLEEIQNLVKQEFLR